MFALLAATAQLSPLDVFGMSSNTKVKGFGEQENPASVDKDTLDMSQAPLSSRSSHERSKRLAQRAAGRAMFQGGARTAALEEHGRSEQAGA
eukprot:CAMPEP_0206232184 /NCGR_PEP_ID=MMETSP0047_2-20121206/11275_1 /ASSEMBLY_ACC=CAM_ASM_000192 /TAXON_ID=195065 /ORGANISM="Chroomonas mesostigmatica_cf, Strain CCMP1168" /LENGTH=91 /DNA_ID=CAMNT_0053655893 /DNA_START=26 /DNA_END=300 /DNA_ORIENTATION=+